MNEQALAEAGVRGGVRPAASVFASACIVIGCILGVASLYAAGYASVSLSLQEQPTSDAESATPIFTSVPTSRGTMPGGSRDFSGRQRMGWRRPSRAFSGFHQND